MWRLDLCKKVAEIEGLSWLNHSSLGSSYETKHYLITGTESTYTEYNPLTDDALCLKLMVKYKVSVEVQSIVGESLYYAHIDCQGGSISGDIRLSICLAIVDVHGGGLCM